MIRGGRYRGVTIPALYWRPTRGTMSRVSLTVLGGFEARTGPTVVNLPRKAEALLAYLALAPAATHTRSKLAALLWTDMSDDDARNNLRQVLFRTRRGLGRASDVLTINGEVIGLDQGAVETDVGTLRRAVASGSEQELRAAAALCRGKLLDGMDVVEPAFEEWLAGERETVHGLVVSALLRLIEREEKQKAMDGVVAAGLRLLAFDSLQEPAHRALMRAYATQGRRAVALRQYQVCADVLQRELQAEPEPATKALYRELLRPSASSVGGRLSESKGFGAEAPAIVQPPLTGRSAELAALSSGLDEALGGLPRPIAVFGEAGVGKTRLAAEIEAIAVSRGCLVLKARAYETEAGLPLALWASAVRSADIAENRAIIETLGGEWRDALNPLFRDLPGRRSRGTVESENQLRMFEALSRLLTTVAARQSLVVILEDLQWADETSVRFLAFIGRRVDAARLYMVLTVRPEDAGRGNLLATALSELRREGRLLELSLWPLTRPDATALIQALAPRTGRHLPAAVVDRVWRMSEGNPFVIVEALRRVGTDPWPDSATDLPLPARVR
jgi:DNA-binding SARP family transcriptional activator